jgi:uncharacterized protein (TIGR03435 family)
MLFPSYKPAQSAALFTLSIITALPLCSPPKPADAQAASSATGTPASDAGKLQFEVASVRPAAQASSVKGMDFLNPASNAAPPPGGLFSWSAQLPWLINFAYDLRSSQARRTARESLPKWAQDDWFTIEARAEGNPTRDNVRQMVRSLLQSRFQLAAHMGMREAQVYALVVAKPGMGLKPHPEGAPCTLAPLRQMRKSIRTSLPPTKRAHRTVASLVAC